MLDGITDWTDVVRPGVPSFRFVDEFSEADIPVIWADEPSGDWYIAYCTYQPSYVKSLWGAENILVTARWPDGQIADVHDVYTVMLHEMGHALGLAGHSPSQTDIMHARINRRQSGLSQRDRNTIRLLYARPSGTPIRGARRDQ